MAELTDFQKWLKNEKSTDLANISDKGVLDNYVNEFKTGSGLSTTSSITPIAGTGYDVVGDWSAFDRPVTSTTETKGLDNYTVNLSGAKDSAGGATQGTGFMDNLYTGAQNVGDAVSDFAFGTDTTSDQMNKYAMDIYGKPLSELDEKTVTGIKSKLDTQNAGMFSGQQGLSNALGLGQLGLGVMGYLDQKKTAKKQRALLDQQLASNKDIMATRQARAADIKKYFGSPTGLGA